MLGFSDIWISLAYLSCIGVTLLCVIYGLVNWNKGDDNAKDKPEEKTV